MKCKAIYMIGSLLVLMSALLCSCGVNSTKDNKTLEKDVEVATGSAVTAVFKNSETTVKKEAFANDHFRIFRSDTEDDECVSMMENLDRTGRTQVDVEIWDALWLTNDWLYYYDYTEGYDPSDDNVYRVPLDYTKEPVYDLKNKEKLFQSSGVVGGDSFFVTDAAVFCIKISKFDYSNGSMKYKDGLVSSAVYRYDLQSGETIKLLEVEEVADCCFLTDITTDMPILCGEYFFLEANGKIYRVSVDTLDVKEVYQFDDVGYNILDSCVNGNMVYFISSAGILKYSPDMETVVNVLDNTALKNKLDDMELCDENASEISYSLDAISVWNDKIYLNVEVEWSSMETIAEGKEKGKKTWVYFYRDVLLSAPLDNLNQWKLEDTLVDYLRDNAPKAFFYDTIRILPAKLEKKDTIAINAHIIYIHDNEVLFYISNAKNCSDEDAEFQLGIYSLDTEDITLLEKSDWRYDWYETRSF